MRQLRIGALAMALALVPLGALAEEAPAEKYELADGSTLFLHPGGAMRMVDVHGKPMQMTDGVVMELKDGRQIMMQNKLVWITIGPPGKGTTVQKAD